MNKDQLKNMSTKEQYIVLTEYKFLLEKTMEIRNKLMNSKCVDAEAFNLFTDEIIRLTEIVEMCEDVLFKY